MERTVIPEILDHLAVDDPRAVRSRRDLRMINFLMGNERWLVSRIRGRAESESVSELGSGRGELLSLLGEQGRRCRGYDLQPRPEGLSALIGWEEGDFFQTLREDSSEIVVGSLILHHFEEEQLLELGRILSSKRALFFAEPLRSRFAIGLGRTLFPFCNEVTKHDMIVSIRAGFARGELAQKLGLTEGWEWREQVTWRGGLRSVAVRQVEID